MGHNVEVGGWRLQQRSGHATLGGEGGSILGALTMSRKSCSSDAILLDVLSSRCLQSWEREGKRGGGLGGYCQKS